MSPQVLRLRNGGLGFLLAAFLAAASIHPVSAASPFQSAADGQAIFQARCTGCHTIGGGTLVGPDLKGVTQQRDLQWLTNFISAPDKVLASGDPIATALLKQFNNVAMPNLGLTPDQVSAVIAYLQTQGGAAGTPAPAQTPTPGPAGDPDRGHALFVHRIHFRGGGPPCMGCHSIDSVGILGGGVMGPNLTPAFAKYGDAGLAAALANIAWPVMKPIYGAHPLTPQEQADLRAFLQAESGQPQASTLVPVIVLSLSGFFAAMIVIGFVWRRRLHGVRRRLVEGSRTEN